jgi:D-sedoheptulose 7-phosphate isomerase
MLHHSLSDSVSGYFTTMQQVIAQSKFQAIDAYVEELFAAWLEGRRVFVFGNRGSALTASHHVADYVKTASVEGQPRLQAFSLNDNAGLITELGNDLSYEETFRWTLEAFARPGDVAVAISASGNSPNVVSACRWARDFGLVLVCLTGFSGGKIGELADIHIHFPSDNYGVVEDLHMAVGHIAAQSLRCRILVSPDPAIRP